MCCVPECRDNTLTSSLALNVLGLSFHFAAYRTPGGTRCPLSWLRWLFFKMEDEDGRFDWAVVAANALCTTSTTSTPSRSALTWVAPITPVIVRGEFSFVIDCKTPQLAANQVIKSFFKDCTPCTTIALITLANRHL